MFQNGSRQKHVWQCGLWKPWWLVAIWSPSADQFISAKHITHATSMRDDQVLKAHAACQTAATVQHIWSIAALRYLNSLNKARVWGPVKTFADQSSSPWQLRGNPARSSPACYWSRTAILSKRNHHPNLHACGQDTNPPQMLKSNSQEARHTQEKHSLGSEEHGDCRCKDALTRLLTSNKTEQESKGSRDNKSRHIVLANNI